MNKFTSTQIEQIKEIGSYLKQKRLELALPLEQVFVSTHIRTYVLTALEEGKIEDLPELIYIQGFIRRYAAFLQLDPQSLTEKLTSFESNPEEIKTDDPNLERITITPAEIVSKNKFNPNLLYFSLLIPVILGGCYFLFRPNQSQLASSEAPQISATPVKSEKLKTESTAKTEVSSSKPVTNPVTTESKAKTEVSSSKTATNPVTTQSKPKTEVTNPKTVTNPVKTESKAKTEVSSSKTATNPVTTQSKPKSEVSNPKTATNQVSVKIKLEDSSWLRVKIDEKTVFEGLMEKGTEKTWTGSQKISLRAGNAGAVNFSVNQQPSKPLGKLGEVKDISLTSTSQ